MLRSDLRHNVSTFRRNMLPPRRWTHLGGWLVIQKWGPPFCPKFKSNICSCRILLPTYQNTRHHNPGAHNMSLHHHINYHTWSKLRTLYVLIVHYKPGGYFKRLLVEPRLIGSVSARETDSYLLRPSGQHSCLVCEKLRVQISTRTLLSWLGFFMVFLSHSMENLGWYIKLGHYRFLLHFFWFITQSSSYSLTLFSLKYWQVVR
jgi:hypothetical protein